MQKQSVVAILTDFGADDPYAGMLKGVISSFNPKITFVDLSHSIPSHNISIGAFVLGRSFKYFTDDTVFIAVVDPTVGSERRAIILKTDRQSAVAPDNGILSYVLKYAKVEKIIKITNPKYFLSDVCPTFHGRDIFAPVAAHLTMGIPPEVMGEEIKDPVKLEIKYPRSGKGNITADVIYVDKFGNLITNLTKELFGANTIKEIKITNRFITGVKEFYSSGYEGELMAVWGGFGTLEIAVKEGNAAKILGVDAGEEIFVTEEKIA
ncbi:MAG: SAM-dependent chlorinase/fluorinase [Firmicutes bacterium]|nr:SAM-dependent chlorinase/fluorinase [Bacillota bacterium]